ncbi:putative 4-hydroxy-4-methyl-2-oxoglutarate aldolase [Tersicoccus solisilvae]|uniref:4-hydroxy-4-methyl-2-oxoglutarate aldolase n=1 Tax=Tersicoccus solisilvae TaxID=1882339 RepID=A0ABQ1P9P0_9MICC|nr:ribonuclease E activity regulator RraA [Tersicoccus solisilvae]GGC89512.1 putative 4-hydroxy-4-methyl-2-oxoglutarate aldolase [Tersicoccus solisilvae]
MTPTDPAGTDRTAADPTARATADLWDERGEDLQSVDVPFLDLGGRTRFSGPVRTVRCRHDNALVKSVLAGPGDGAVLVVDGGGLMHTALMGDLIAASAVQNGWAGVIIHGPVRDRAALATLPLGVKALGSNPRKSAKEGTGERDVPVTFGDVTFRPGATVWADEDGIVVER